MQIHPLHRIKIGIQYHPYFFFTFPAIAVFYYFLDWLTQWGWSTCLLISWNIAIYSYLLLTLKKLWRTEHENILQRAQQQDASKWLILLLVVLTLIMCFIAIVIEINHLPYRFSPLFLHGFLCIPFLPFIIPMTFIWH